MPWSTPKGFNIRNTAAYVTDGVNETYVLPTDAYPTTRTIGGESVTFGWESVGASDGRDRTTASPYAPELSGVMNLLSAGDPNGNGPWVFRVDLPASGEYQINLALGDAQYANTAYAEIDDTATAVVSYPQTSTAIGQFMDASGALLTAANWQSSNTPITKTFTTNVFRFKLLKPTANASVVSHIALTQIAVARAGSNPSGMLLVPASGAANVTPSDSADLPTASLRLWVGGAGNVAVITVGGEAVTYSSVAAGMYLNVRVSRVMATGTTATNIIAEY